MQLFQAYININFFPKARLILNYGLKIARTSETVARPCSHSWRCLKLYLVLLGDAGDEEVGSHVVDVRHENVEEVWHRVDRVVELGYSLLPVLPLTALVDHKLEDRLIGVRLRQRQVARVTG